MGPLSANFAAHLRQKVSHTNAICRWLRNAAGKTSAATPQKQSDEILASTVQYQHELTKNQRSNFCMVGRALRTT